MKIPYLLILMASTSLTNVYAETPIGTSTNTPPALNNNVYGVLPPPASEQNLQALTQEVSKLKAMTRQQARQIKNLHKKLAISKQQMAAKPAVVTQTQATPTASKAEEKAYNAALSAFKRGHLAQANSGFNQILTRYPNGKYASNAQFWMAESFLRKGDKKSAMLGFDKVIHTYPKSVKVPDSLYKLGVLQLNLGRKAKAAEYFNYVIQYYPHTNASKLSATKKAAAKL